MSTPIRPELSKKNKYWIERHRYYELKHFCLQYQSWKKIVVLLDSLSKTKYDELMTKTNKHLSPVERCIMEREYYLERMEMIEKAAKLADESLASYILKGVTEGLSYEYLKTRLDIPCCRDTFYDRYRKFFWILNEIRK